MAAADRWIGWDLRCDSQELRLGDPRHAWRLLDGFSGIGSSGGRLVAGEAAALVVLGAPAEGTTIYVEGRTEGRKVEVEVQLNRRPLGVGTFRKRFDILAFPVPPEAARRGLNVLRLEPQTARQRPAPRLTLRRIGVGPLRCRGDDPSAIEVAADEPLVLSRESLVLIPFGPGREPPRLVEASFRAPPPSAVTLWCWTASDVVALTRLEGGSRGRAHRFVPLAGECAGAGARGLALLGEGPRPARRVRVDLDPERGIGWRARVRWRMAALLSLVLAAGFLALRRLRSRGYFAAAPGGRAWLDVGWIVLIALLPRIAFWAVYRAPGEAGDSFEYLLRAGFLARGELDFWRHLDWHTWGTFIRPPGYFALLALFDAPAEAGRVRIIALQLVLSAATAGLTYLLTLPLFGRLAAWCAGIFFAFYLGSIATFTRILAEPVFMFLVTAGLAGVAWLARRPSARLALAAGALFGLAALVRPGPVYYPPLAGLLLIPTHGRAKGLRLTAALVLGLAAVTLPWGLRNTLVAGRPVGVETVSVANFLINHPDGAVVPTDGLDLETREGRIRYRARVHSAAAGPLTTHKGPHVRRILRAAARDPGAQLRRTVVNLRNLFSPAPDAWLDWILRESDALRVARLTSLLNWQYGVAQALALAGFVLFLRRARFWPLAAWIFLTTGLLTFFFHAVLRYREPSTPVLLAFAGGAVAAAIERLSVVKKSGLS